MKSSTAFFLAASLVVMISGAPSARADGDVPTETVRVRIGSEYIDSLKSELNTVGRVLVDQFADDTSGPRPVIRVPRSGTQGLVCNRIWRVDDVLERALNEVVVANWIRFDQAGPFPGESMDQLITMKHQLEAYCTGAAGPDAPIARLRMERDLNTIYDAVNTLLSWSNTIRPSAVEADSRAPRAVPVAQSSTPAPVVPPSPPYIVDDGMVPAN